MQKTRKERRQSLTIKRETVTKLDDKALQSIAGGCDGMPWTCRCTSYTY